MMMMIIIIIVSLPCSHLGHSHLLSGLLRRPPQLPVALRQETPVLQVQVRLKRGLRRSAPVAHFTSSCLLICALHLPRPPPRPQGPGEQLAVLPHAATGPHAAAVGLLRGRQRHLDGVSQRRPVSAKAERDQSHVQRRTSGRHFVNAVR